MAYISKQQLQQAITQLPAGSNPRDFLDQLVQRGNTIEGYNDGTNHDAQSGIQQAQDVSYTPTTPPKSVGGFVGNVFKSTGRTISGLASAVVNVFNPDMQKNTVANLGRTALGVVEKAIPGRQGAEDQADALGRFFKERYGGWQNIKDTLYNDPVGVALDIATVLDGGGAAVKAAGLSGKAGELNAITEAAGAVTKAEKAAAIYDAIKNGQLGTTAKVGQGLQDVAETVNPITQATKAAGAVVNKVAPKVSLGADTFDAGTAATFGKYDINPTASMVNTNPVVGQVEALAGKGMLGGASKIGKQVADVENAVKGVGTAAAGNATLESAGKLASEGFNQFVDTGRQASKALYAAAESEAVTISAANLENTVKTLDDILAKQQDTFAGNPTLLKEVQKIKDAITGGDASLIQGSPDFMAKNAGKLQETAFTTKTLANTIRDLYDKTSFGSEAVQTGAKGQLSRLIASMEQDLNGVMEANPEKFVNTRAATSHYRQFINTVDSDFGKAISKNQAAPSVIVKKVLNNATPVEDIPRIMSTVGDKAATEIQQAVIRDMIEGASSNAKVSEALTPAGLARKIDAFGEAKLKALLTPEQFEIVQDIKKMAQATARGSKIMEGSQTTFTAKTTALITGLFTAPHVAVPALVSNIAFNKFVTSATGQRILKSGIQLNGALGQAFYQTAAKYGKTAELLNAGNKANQANKK